MGPQLKAPRLAGHASDQIIALPVNRPETRVLQFQDAVRHLGDGRRVAVVGVLPNGLVVC